MSESAPLTIVSGTGDLVSGPIGGASLIARGLADLGDRSAVMSAGHDDVYLRARRIFNRRHDREYSYSRLDGFSWNEHDDPEMFAAYQDFERLAYRNDVRAYFPFCVLEKCRGLEERFEKNWKGSKLLMTGWVRRDRSMSSIEPRAVAAFQWCLRNQLDADGQASCDLGEMYSYGLGVERDYEKAFISFQTAANLGNLSAQLWLYDCYINGCGADEDKDLSEYWARKAAEQGDAYAQYNFACMFYDGGAVQRDWLLKAAEQGFLKAKEELAQGYSTGREPGWPKDDIEATRWYLQIAEECPRWYGSDVAKRYAGGLGVPLDAAAAANWFQRAASAGCCEGQFELGKCYERGWGVPQDDIEAARCYQQAFELDRAGPFTRDVGHFEAKAVFTLAECYFNGRGVPRDLALAADLYQRLVSTYWFGKQASARMQEISSMGLR